MNANYSPSSARFSRGGFALVIVLITIGFVVVLLVAFLASVSAEKSASSGFKASASARQLSQTVISIVQAQIRVGTLQGPNVAWTSQPGLIRTFDNTGAALTNFKLYSSTAMQTTGAFTSTLAQADIPTDWLTRTNEFTDLNSPVALSTGTTVYPILDPGANGLVQGFSISASAPVGTGTNPAPMPVAWLYVLQDGEIVAYNSNKITATNVPIGRVAFWTDDECAKINLNTASEGVFWDTPRAISVYEVNNLAKFQGAANEYQRYPGHPAMNCLSPVLGQILFGNNTPTTWSDLQPYYQIAPRVPTANTSQAGTVAVTAAATLKTDRLYPTVDEVIYNASRTLVASTAATNNAINYGKFFLTTSSRAPDVNLFNRPRVGIWPLNANTTSTYRTTLDNLIAFCGTINSLPYYFQRQDSTSATTDLPTTAATSGLGRNRMLINYLDKLTDTAIPGYGGNFLSKYGSDRDQILTEIFDYIRCVNLQDTTSTTLKSYTPKNTTPGTGQVVPIYDVGTDTRGFGRFPTVSQAFLLFIGYDDHNTDATVAAGKIRVQAVFLPEMFTPAMGFSLQTPDFGVKVEGLDAFKWNSTSSMNFTSPAETDVTIPNNATKAYAGGGLEGFNYIAWGKRLATTGGADFPFYSTTMDFDTTAGNTFSFVGGDVTVTVLGPSVSGTRTAVQTIKMTFPSATIPVPTGVIKEKYLGIGDSNPLSFNRFGANQAVSPTPALPVAALGGRFYNTLTTGASTAWITSKDVVRGICASGVNGDIRLVAARNSIATTDNIFVPESRYTDQTQKMAHSLFTAQGYPFYGASRGKLVNNASYYNTSLPTTANDLTYDSTGYIGNGGGIQQITMDHDVPTNGVYVGAGGTLPGDWDNGLSCLKDGAYINKVDEGDVSNIGTAGSYPYFTSVGAGVALGPTFFSANRQIPSAGMFGSLPTGVKSKRPWQTLLFHPDPTGLHPGNAGLSGTGTTMAGAPGDFLMLDFFHMPVVEPYAISEPLSTAGRINMNYQIMPFTYLTRQTGIWSVLKSEQLLAIPTAQASNYKINFGSLSSVVEQANFRKSINIPETLKGFEAKFATNDVFHSASEICTLPLVPSDGTYATMNTYWSAYALTGDNSRERPYADIYPRLTTRSNVFTVHMRVQALTALKTKPGFNPATDFVVSSEYRGSCGIERFVDPNNTRLPDFTDMTTYPLGNATADINNYYEFRQVNPRQFSP